MEWLEDAAEDQYALFILANEESQLYEDEFDVVDLSDESAADMDFSDSESVSDATHSDQEVRQRNPDDGGEKDAPIVTTNTASEEPSNKDLDKSQTSDDNCPICFDAWTTSGSHRIVSLKCGHLFGRMCVEKWLKSQNRKPRCPQCNAPARKTDIRNIFARSVRPVDVGEKDKITKQLEREKSKRKEAEKQLDLMETRLVETMSENEKLKKDLIECKSQLQAGRSANRVNSAVATNKAFVLKNRMEPFKLVCSCELSAVGGCRLLASSAILDTIVATMPSPNPLFPGYGIRKLSLDLRCHEFMHLHQKVIKDITFHPTDEMLLSTGLDKTIKATSLLSGSSVATYKLDVDAWSLCWNLKNSNYFYAGLRNGSVLEYDIRMSGGHVSELLSRNTSPVVSLNCIQKDNFSGILATHLSSSYFHQALDGSESTFESFDVPVEGSLMSSHFDKKSGYSLVSIRPSSKTPLVTHTVMDLNVPSSGSFRSKTIRSFNGGTRAVQLTRSKLFPHPSDETSSLVCAGDEACHGAIVWDLNNDHPPQTLNFSTTSSPSACSNSTAFDFSLITSQSNTVLAVLTENRLNAYKWTL